MTMTAIKVPKATRDRLHRLAAADGVTLAQEIQGTRAAAPARHRRVPQPPTADR